MKTIIALVFCCLISTNNYSQIDSKLSIDTTSKGLYTLSLSAHEKKLEGKKPGQAFWSDDSYLNRTVSPAILNVVSKEKLDTLGIRSRVRLYFNKQGEVFTCWFNILNEEKNVFSDSILYELYKNLMDIKFDTSMINIRTPFYGTYSDSLDYAVISISLRRQ